MRRDISRILRSDEDEICDENVQRKHCKHFLRERLVVKREDFAGKGALGDGWQTSVFESY